jgi:hypothetical protein
MHPLLVEAWLVKEGRMEAGAADVALDPAAWWRGWMGWSSLLRGWGDPGPVLGTYQEVAITTPARLAVAGGETCAYVAAMYTDSPVAVWGDQTLECGYRKRLARIAHPSPTRWRVTSPEGAPIVALDLAPVDGGGDLGPAGAGPILDDRLTLPYLGGLEGGRFAISVLDRSAGERSTIAAPITGHITGAAGFVEGLPAMAARISPLSEHDRWGGFRFEGIRARLTHPRHGSL